MAALSNYETKCLLGEGSHGVVHLAECTQDGQLVAIKSLGSFPGTSSGDMDRIEAIGRAEAEADATAACAHKNVVAVRETVHAAFDFHIVLEYCSGGDLLSFLQGRPRLSEDEGRKIFGQLVAALDHIHRSGFVHRDLKCENILLADKQADRVVIADFGFATCWARGVRQNASVGSLHYSSPEICAGAAYEGPEIDVWSLGVVLYALVTRSLPFLGDRREITDNICDGVFRIPSHVSPDCRNLIRAMLTPEPRLRATLAAVQRHPWLAPAAA